MLEIDFRKKQKLVLLFDFDFSDWIEYVCVDLRHIRCISWCWRWAIPKQTRAKQTATSSSTTTHFTTIFFGFKWILDAILAHPHTVEVKNLKEMGKKSNDFE